MSDFGSFRPLDEKREWGPVETGEPDPDPEVHTLPRFTAVRKKADESVTSSTTLQDDDELFFNMEPNLYYRVEVSLHFFGATGGDIKAAFSLPSNASARGSWSKLGAGASGPAAVATDTWDARDPTTARPAGATGAASSSVMLWQGLVDSGDGGEFQVQWAQNSSSGTATTVNAMSYLTAYRVP